MQSSRGGGTWSNSEYGHAGLASVYLRLKSVQRFTEAWALYERAASARLFAPAKLEARTLRVVSIGGGPGFELLAFDWFWRYLRDAHALRRATLAARAAQKEKEKAARSAALRDGKGGGGASGFGAPALGLQTSWADAVSSDGESDGEDPALRTVARARPETAVYDWLLREGGGAAAGRCEGGGAHDGGASPGASPGASSQHDGGAGASAAAEPAEECNLELISLDLQPSWGQYVHALSQSTAGVTMGRVRSSYSFVQADLNTLHARGGSLRARLARELGAGAEKKGGDGSGGGGGGARSRAGGRANAAQGLPHIDYCILSNILIYCSDTRTADMLASLLHSEGVRAVLVSERGTEQSMVEMLQARGIAVRRLMAQDVGRDDRQLLFEPGPPKPGADAPPVESGVSWDLGVAFPNVPYEERKEELRRAPRGC